eukprot:evm.model.scf_48.1 EVM.evm.TU.scf_48.1   scf_48:1950-2558(-)
MHRYKFTCSHLQYNTQSCLYWTCIPGTSKLALLHCFMLPIHGTALLLCHPSCSSTRIDSPVPNRYTRCCCMDAVHNTDSHMAQHAKTPAPPKHSDILTLLPAPPERGYPLANLEYLLSVLPKISAGLLPDDLRSLVTNTNSPVASLYPNQYMVDTDGARCPEEQVIQLDRFDIDCLVEHFREADLAKLDVLGERLVEKNSPGE